MFLRGILLAVTMLVSVPALARIFIFQEQKMAAYFNVSGGVSALGDKAVKDEATGVTGISGTSKYTYSGEFGFLAHLNIISLKLGLDIISPAAILGGNATGSAGSLYSFDSSMFGYAYKLGVDINLRQQVASRSYINIGVGQANIKMTNKYDLTAAGQATYSGISNHEVESETASLLYQLAFGYEGHFADKTSLVAELGYRYLPLTDWKYKGNGTTFSGAYSSGANVKDINGKAREIDLSGAYILLGVRVYL